MTRRNSQARKLTQVRLAKTLGITQDGVSRLEKRSDLLLSTLRKSVEAMGGNLSLVAEFPDREPVVLSGIAATELDPKPLRPTRQGSSLECGAVQVGDAPTTKTSCSTNTRPRGLTRKSIAAGRVQSPATNQIDRHNRIPPARRVS